MTNGCNLDGEARKLRQHLTARECCLEVSATNRLRGLHNLAATGTLKIAVPNAAAGASNRSASPMHLKFFAEVTL